MNENLYFQDFIIDSSFDQMLPAMSKSSQTFFLNTFIYSGLQTAVVPQSWTPVYE